MGGWEEEKAKGPKAEMAKGGNVNWMEARSDEQGEEAQRRLNRRAEERNDEKGKRAKL